MFPDSLLVNRRLGIGTRLVNEPASAPPMWKLSHTFAQG